MAPNFEFLFVPLEYCNFGYKNKVPLRLKLTLKAYGIPTTVIVVSSSNDEKNEESLGYKSTIAG